MRRLPRPQSSIDALIYSSTSLRPRLPPSQCLAQCSPLRISSAPFSTSLRHNATFDSKAADDKKKKHQAFVRRWQKRLLGEEEPVGAHVDPYDATSPVRIAPEEQGEEQEVLEPTEYKKGYEPAKTWHRLEWVGGERWEQNWNEWSKRDQGMWKDFNPEVRFAPSKKTMGTSNLRTAFHQATVEILTLWSIGADKELKSLPRPSKMKEPLVWIQDVKLKTSETEGIALDFPHKGAKEELLYHVLQGYRMGSAKQQETFKKELEELSEGNAESELAENSTKQETVPNAELKYRHIDLTDLNIKFAMAKRLLQLTGIHISDPLLNEVSTFGDLYSHLCAAAKPKQNKVSQVIQTNKKTRELLSLPNVKVRSKRQSSIDRDKEVGRWKVIQYALKERGLPVQSKDAAPMV